MWQSSYRSFLDELIQGTAIRFRKTFWQHNKYSSVSTVSCTAELTLNVKSSSSLCLTMTEYLVWNAQVDLDITKLFSHITSRTQTLCLQEGHVCLHLLSDRKIEEGRHSIYTLLNNDIKQSVVAILLPQWVYLSGHNLMLHQKPVS